MIIIRINASGGETIFNGFPWSEPRKAASPTHPCYDKKQIKKTSSRRSDFYLCFFSFFSRSKTGTGTVRLIELFEALTVEWFPSSLDYLNNLLCMHFKKDLYSLLFVVEPQVTYSKSRKNGVDKLPNEVFSPQGCVRRTPISESNHTYLSFMQASGFWKKYLYIFRIQPSRQCMILP